MMLLPKNTQVLPSILIFAMVTIVYIQQNYVYIQNIDEKTSNIDKRQHVKVFTGTLSQIEKENKSIHLHRPKRGRLETNAKKREMDYRLIDFTNSKEVLKITSDDRSLFFLMIFVHSAFQHFALRNSIRKTWGSVVEQKDKRFKLYFIIGEPDVEHLPLYGRFLAEKDLNQDIIHTNITDSYVNLTLKCIFMLNWCYTHCDKNVQFIVKMDDDVFLNIPNLIPKLNKYSNKYKPDDIPIIGHAIENGLPIRQRSSKYYVPNTFYRKLTYPSYVSGSTYIIPKHVIPKLLSVIPKTGVPFWLEDIYITGMLTKASNVSLLHDKGFNISKNMVTNVLTEVCKKDVITVHQVTTEEMIELWQRKRNC